jgi:hypothetical protein
MNSYPRRPNFVLAWIVVVMAVFSLATDLLFSSKDSPETDRIVDIRHGARIDTGDGTEEFSPSVPGNVAWSPEPASLSPEGLRMPGSLDLEPWRFIQEHLPFALPLASDRLEAGQDPTEGLEATRANGADGSNLPATPASVSAPSGPPKSPVENQPRKPLHRLFDLGASSERTPVAGHGGSGSGSGSQELRFGGSGPDGQSAWQERVQLRTLPSGNVLLVVQLETVDELDSPPMESQEQATGPQVDDETEEEEEAEKAKLRSRVKQAVAPVLPAINAALLQAEKAGVEAKLGQKVRVWVRQRPGGAELATQLTPRELHRLAMEIGPRYPQIAKLLAELR